LRAAKRALDLVELTTRQPLMSRSNKGALRTRQCDDIGAAGGRARGLVLARDHDTSFAGQLPIAADVQVGHRVPTRAELCGSLMNFSVWPEFPDVQMVITLQVGLGAQERIAVEDPQFGQIAASLKRNMLGVLSAPLRVPLKNSDRGRGCGSVRMISCCSR
jgi:hypothetical protein